MKIHLVMAREQGEIAHALAAKTLLSYPSAWELLDACDWDPQRAEEALRLAHERSDHPDTAPELVPALTWGCHAGDPYGQAAGFSLESVTLHLASQFVVDLGERAQALERERDSIMERHGRLSTFLRLRGR
jgi:hypothetical protein